MASRSGSGYWIIALLCLTALYIACLGGLQTYPAFGDGPSIYIVSAQSLAHNTGYRLINYPQAPPSQLYPIGYPLLLSVIFRLLPYGTKSILLARLLSVASTVLWVEATRRLLLNVVRPMLAAIITLAMGLIPLALEMSGVIKADLVFAAILTPMMVLAVNNSASGTSRQIFFRAVLLGVLAACAMLVRTIGFTLIIGLALDLLLRRRWSQLFWFFAAVAVVAAPWMLWCAFNYGGTFRSYTAENIITWRTPISNFWTLASRTAPGMGFALFDTGSWKAVASRLHLSWIPMLFGVGITALVIIGWISLLRRLHVVALVLAPYMAIVFLWWWEPSRFVVPVLPLILFCAIVGVKIVFAQLSIPQLKVGLTVAAASILGGLFVDTVSLHRALRYGDPQGEDSVKHWAQMQQGLNWIKNNTPSDAVVFSSYPAGVYLFTSRHTLDMSNSSHVGTVYTPSNSTDLASLLQKNSAYHPLYIFAPERKDALTNVEFGIAPVKRFLDDHPGGLELEWASAMDYVLIYKVIAINDRTGVAGDIISDFRGQHGENHSTISHATALTYRD